MNQEDDHSTASGSSYPPRTVWTNEEIQTIINAVRQRPYLYDKKHEDYKHNQKKDMAWEKIAMILKTRSGKECKRKWNTLRIQQRRIIIQRIKKKGKQIQWHCFNSLQFLVPHMEWTSSRDVPKKELSEEEEFENTTCDFDETKPSFSDGQLMISTVNNPLTTDDSQPHSTITSNTIKHQHQEQSADEITEDEGGNVSSQRLILPYDPQHHQLETDDQICSNNNDGSGNVDETIDVADGSISQDINGGSDNNIQSVPQELIRIIQQTSCSAPTMIDRSCLVTQPPSSMENQIYAIQRTESIQPHLTHNTLEVQAQCRGGRMKQSIQYGSSQSIDSSAGDNGGGGAVNMMATVTNSASTESSTQLTSSPSMTALSLNYFLMDIQIQMEKLHEFAQLEVKIEIQKLLLEKLRNPENYIQRND